MVLGHTVFVRVSLNIDQCSGAYGVAYIYFVFHFTFKQFFEDKNKILCRDTGLEYRNRMEDKNKILNRDNGLEYRNRMEDKNKILNRQWFGIS